MPCPECRNLLAHVNVETTSRGNGIYVIDQDGYMRFEEDENLVETEEFECPECEYQFENKTEAEKVLREDKATMESEENA